MANKKKRLRVNFSCKADVAFGEDAPVGSADSVVNLRGIGTALTPVGSLVEIAEIGQGSTIIATHRTADGVNLIIVSGGTLIWSGTISAEGIYGEVGLELGALDGDVLAAETLADFVVIGCSTGEVYLYYSGGSYTILDPTVAVPELYIDSSVVDTAVATVPEYEFEDEYTRWQSPLSSADIAGISDNMSTAYSELATAASSAGGYIQPILVRYGVRLFDDSYLWISQPVAIGEGIQCGEKYEAEVDDDGSVYTAVESFSIEADVYKIVARAVSGFDSSWDGLIKSVDILVSAEAAPLLTSQTVGYRCETSSSSEHLLRLWFQSVDSDVVMSGLLGTESWSVAYMITDFDALREGTATLCPVASELTVDSDVVSECARRASCRSVSTSIMPHNRSLFTAGSTSILHSGWGLIPSIVVDTDYFSVETYQAVAVATLATVQGKAVTVWTGSGCGRPTALNPVVAYPDSRAVSLKVTVMLASGSILEATLTLQPDTASGMAYATGSDFEQIELEESTLTELEIPDEENIEQSAAGIVNQSVELNPLVTSERHTVCDGLIRAIGSTMHRSSTVIGTPLYIFTDGGVYAMPYRTSSATYAPAVIVTHHVIASGTLPVNTDSYLCFATAEGELCGLSQYHITRLLRSVGEMSAMAYCLPRRELWLLSAQGDVTVVDADGRRYARTDEPATLFDSSAAIPLAVDADGVVYDVTVENSGDTSVALLTEPFSPSADEMWKLERVTLLAVAESIDAQVALYGDTAYSCHGMMLCRLSLDGSVNTPVPFGIYSPPVRKIRLEVTGTLSSEAILGGAVINYTEIG